MTIPPKLTEQQEHAGVEALRCLHAFVRGDDDEGAEIMNRFVVMMGDDTFWGTVVGLACDSFREILELIDLVLPPEAGVDYRVVLEAIRDDHLNPETGR